MDGAPIPVSNALLLDYNGVVVNDEPLHFASFRDVLATHNLKLDARTYYAEYLGFDDRSAFVEAWRRANRTITGELLRVLVEDKAQRYAQLTSSGVPPVTGSPAFMHAAAQRWPIAVVSGALRQEIEAGLAQLGVASAVTAVVSAEDTGSTKPDPAGYRLAVRRLADAGRPVRRAVVIEDSLPGLEAARGIGAGCVLLTTSLPAAELAAADDVWADFSGHAVDELDPLFKPLR